MAGPRRPNRRSRQRETVSGCTGRVARPRGARARGSTQRGDQSSTRGACTAAAHRRDGKEGLNASDCERCVHGHACGADQIQKCDSRESPFGGRRLFNVRPGGSGKVAVFGFHDRAVTRTAQVGGSGVQDPRRQNLEPRWKVEPEPRTGTENRNREHERGTRNREPGTCCYGTGVFMSACTSAWVSARL